MASLAIGYPLVHGPVKLFQQVKAMDGLLVNIILKDEQLLDEVVPRQVVQLSRKLDHPGEYVCDHFVQVTVVFCDGPSDFSWINFSLGSLSLGRIILGRSKHFIGFELGAVEDSNQFINFL